MVIKRKVIKLTVSVNKYKTIDRNEWIKNQQSYEKSMFFFICVRSIIRFSWMMQKLFRFELFENYIFYIVVYLFVFLCVKISFLKNNSFRVCFCNVYCVSGSLYFFSFTLGYSMCFERQHTIDTKQEKKIYNTHSRTKLTMPQWIFFCDFEWKKHIKFGKRKTIFGAFEEWKKKKVIENAMRTHTWIFVVYFYQMKILLSTLLWILFLRNSFKMT